MPRKIGEITGEMMLSGVFPDLPHKQPPVFRTAKNVLFTDNSIQPIPGQYVLTAGSGGIPVRGLLSIREGSTPVLFFGDDATLYRFTISGGTTEVGVGFANAGNAWSMRRWGSWILATNNVNSPQIFKGSSFAALTGASGVFNTVRKFLTYKNYALAFNTDLNDSRIAWCTANDPETWVAALTNTARSIDIRDTTSGITDANIANERIYYWTLKSMSVMSFVGPPVFFSSNLVTDDIGAFGPMSTTEVAGNVYGIGPNGIWQTDGASYRYIDAPVHDEIFGNINLDQAHKCVAWHDVFTSQVVFWIPGENADEVSYGMGFNYKDRNWAPRGDTRTAALEAGDFKWGLLGDTAGNIYAQSLVDDPVTAQDPHLHAFGQGFLYVPLGNSGFGQGGFGGALELTE